MPGEAKLWTEMSDAEKAAAEANFQAQVIALGFVLADPNLQMLVEGEARTLIAKAREAKLVSSDPPREAGSEVSDLAVALDKMLIVALDSLRQSGVEKPLAPLAWELYEQADLQDDVGNTIWLLGSRASNSLGLTTEFLRVSDEAVKDVLRVRLRARGLLRAKRQEKP